MSLEQDLEEALREIDRRSRIEEGLGSGRFTQLLNNRGGVGAAMYSLRPQSSGPGGGFNSILDAGRPDLTLEYVVLQNRFRRLFDQKELDEARRRLGWIQNPAIMDVTKTIEVLAPDYSFGNLCVANY